MSMECSSMVSIATLGPGDPGSNPAGSLSLNPIEKWVFTNNTSVWFSSKIGSPVLGGTLVGGDK